MSARAAKLSAAAQELLPLHVAVIMDGMGAGPRNAGCRALRASAWAESARAIIKAASEVGFVSDSLHVFVENWNRPKTEVDAIMKYLAYYLQKGDAGAGPKQRAVGGIGQIHRLPEPVQKQLENPGNNYPRTPG